MAFVINKNNNIPAGVNQKPGSNSVIVYDSGNITTVGQPGQGTGPKLTNGTQQSATTNSCDSSIKGGGNNYPTAAEVTYGGAANGFSILHE